MDKGSLLGRLYATILFLFFPRLSSKKTAQDKPLSIMALLGSKARPIVTGLREKELLLKRNPKASNFELLRFFGARSVFVLEDGDHTRVRQAITSSIQSLEPNPERMKRIADEVIGNTRLFRTTALAARLSSKLVVFSLFGDSPRRERYTELVSRLAALKLGAAVVGLSPRAVLINRIRDLEAEIVQALESDMTPSEKNIVSLLDKEKLRREEVIDNSKSLLIAGVESLSNTLEWLIHDVENDIRTKNKLLSLIENIESGSSTISESGMYKFCYDSISRTCPMTTAERVVTDSRTAKELEIPIDTRVSIWLEGGMQGQGITAIPFGHGVHSCTGKSLALQILSAALVSLYCSKQLRTLRTGLAFRQRVLSVLPPSSVLAISGKR